MTARKLEPIYIISNGFSLGVRRERFLIRIGEQRKERAAIRTLYVALIGRRGRITSGALALACRHRIPIFVISEKTFLPFLGASWDYSSEALKGFSERWRVEHLLTELREATYRNLLKALNRRLPPFLCRASVEEILLNSYPWLHRSAFRILNRLLEAEVFTAMIKRGIDPFIEICNERCLFIEVAEVYRPLLTSLSQKGESSRTGLREAISEFEKLMKSLAYDPRSSRRLPLREIIHRDCAGIMQFMRGSPLGYKAFWWSD